MEIGVARPEYSEKNIVRNRQDSFPSVHMCKSFGELIDTNSKDVFIITPIETHYKPDKKRFGQNKLAYLEKPFVTSSTQAQGLILLEAKKEFKIMNRYGFIKNILINKRRILWKREAAGALRWPLSLQLQALL